jgi:predicted CDP-diglyceride synthetase/phosphatidate cytidylyltransferase
MHDWIRHIPLVDRALAIALGVAALIAVVARPRGGRFRGLLPWVGFWLVFAGILTCLSRGPAWLSLTMLGVMMFFGLRTYFSIAPVRPRDRYALLAAYLTIPFALYPGFEGSTSTFLATVPVVLFLLLPALLSVGPAQEGLLDSLGRILFGVLLFVFCASHLGLMVRWRVPGLLELFAILVLSSELPQRMAGRFRQDIGWLRPAFGVLAGMALATALGYALGPWCELTKQDGARAGLLVALATTLGTLVTTAVARDLSAGSSVVRISRGTFLDRVGPAIYAAPVFFHYLDHFA